MRILLLKAFNKRLTFAFPVIKLTPFFLLGLVLCLSLEAILIRHDREDSLYVAGVSAIQSFAWLGLSEGRYGVLEYYTRVSSYLDWIDAALAAD